jgi:hypothetical protein
MSVILFSRLCTIYLTIVMGFTRVRKLADKDYQIRRICSSAHSFRLSVRMEHLGFYWTYFREI